MEVLQKVSSFKLTSRRSLSLQRILIQIKDVRETFSRLCITGSVHAVDTVEKARSFSDANLRKSASAIVWMSST
jgi:hypothetical protein